MFKSGVLMVGNEPFRFVRPRIADGSSLIGQVIELLHILEVRWSSVPVLKVKPPTAPTATSVPRPAPPNWGRGIPYFI
jgi:hypothetical protein